MGEPYVPQDAHQRFLIEAWFFLGKNFPSPPLVEYTCFYILIERRPRLATQVMTLGEPRGVGGLAGTATGCAFILHGFACWYCLRVLFRGS